MRYQVAVFGGYNPDYYHFSDPKELAQWLVDQDGKLEVEISEV